MNAALPIAGKLFTDEEVILLGQTFVDCIFRRCLLVFDGRPTSLDGCDITDCRWELAGAAGVTIEFLSDMWAAGSRVLPAQAIGAMIEMDPREALKRLAGDLDIPNEPPR